MSSTSTAGLQLLGHKIQQEQVAAAALLHAHLQQQVHLQCVSLGLACDHEKIQQEAANPTPCSCSRSWPTSPWQQHVYAVYRPNGIGVSVKVDLVRGGWGLHDRYIELPCTQS